MPFSFEELSISEVILIKPKVFSDNRGSFMESYKASDFEKNGISYDFVQDNQSTSEKGVLRGLHFQSGAKEQGKLVRVIEGEIFDVAVDIRENSDTFGNWVGCNLTGQNKEMLFIPPGLAHGFCVLSEYATVHYKATAEYAPEHEGGIIWNDSDLNIAWPVKNPKVSEKDKILSSFKSLYSE